MKKTFIIILLVTITLGATAQKVDSLSLAIARTETVLDSIQKKVTEYQKALEPKYMSLNKEAQLDILDMCMGITTLFEKYLECNKALQEEDTKLQKKNVELQEKLNFMVAQFNEMAKLAKEIAAENKELKQQIK